MIARHPRVAHCAALELERWLTSPHGQSRIDAYTLVGETLFTLNASQTGGN